MLDGVDSDFFNFNVSAGNGSVLSVEDEKIEATANNTIGVSIDDDENSSRVINHEELVSQKTNENNNEFENDQKLKE